MVSFAHNVLVFQIVFSLAHILEPAAAASNLEASLRAELVSLKTDLDKALWGKKKTEDIPEKSKVKMAEVITARDHFQSRANNLEERRKADLKDHARQLADTISDFKKTPDFDCLLLRAVSDFKESIDMKIIVDEAVENGLKAWTGSDEFSAVIVEAEARGAEAWKGSEEFAVAIAEAEARGVEAWKGSEEFVDAIAKDETQGEDDLQYTISCQMPDLDLSFLYQDPPPTPL